MLNYFLRIEIDNVGSEHLVDGKAYAAEVRHFIS